MSSNPWKKKRALDSQAAIADLEQPRFRWKTAAQIGAAFAVLWVTAFMVKPYINFWGLVVVGVLTLVAIGFAIYAWRLTRKSKAIVDILKEATNEEGRKAALKKLESSADASDALNALARAQLIARESPAEAITILESIDVKKAPAVVQDDIRANLAFLYLANNRIRDARTLTEEIRLDRQPHPKAKAMYAAVMAEAYARTSKADEARKLLETFKAGDPEYGEVNAMLLRAQAFTFYATKNRGLAKKAMAELVDLDPNMMGTFLQRGVQPELTKLARDVLAQQGMAPRVKFKARPN